MFDNNFNGSFNMGLFAAWASVSFGLLGHITPEPISSSLDQQLVLMHHYSQRPQDSSLRKLLIAATNSI